MESRRLTRGRGPKVPETAAATSTRSRAAPAAAAPATTATATVGGRRKAAASVETLTDITANRRVTRTSPSRVTRTSPSRRSARISPARSSRPRSTIPTVTVIPVTVEPRTERTANKEKEAPNRATTTTTSSVQSTYQSSTTIQTVEIRTSSGEQSSDIAKLTDYLRRSVSKTFSLGGGGGGDDGEERREGSYTPSQRTDAESRFSRSVSRSVYDGEGGGRYSKAAEFSDAETNEHEDVIHEEDEGSAAAGYGYEEEDNFKSFSANNAAARKSGSFCRKLPIPSEFGGWFGASLLMLLTPLVVYYLQWTCSDRKCEFKIPDYNAILDTNSWLAKIFHIEAVGVFLAFCFGIFILSAVLFGRGVRLPGALEYKFNLLPITAVLSVAYAIAVYFGYPVADFIIKNFQRFSIYSLLNAYVLALWAYYRSDLLKQQDSQCNIYAKSGNFLIDYALGKQLNPKWLGLVDFKLVFYRISLVSSYLYVVSLLYKNIQTPWLPKEVEGGVEMISYFLKNTKFDTTSLLCSGLLLLYVLDSIVFEHHLASSFELQGEGFGCLLLLRYAATPMLVTSVAKYFSENRTPLKCDFAIYIPIALLLLGLALKRFSNAIKYKYRVQPNHPHFQNVETIHTFQGRRLLLGSLWGRLRQPNYLGDILCLIALALPLAMNFVWPPLVSLLLIVAILVHRCFRVNARNSSRYHSSWVRYRSIARNYLIPKIF
ncbi:lamin-B receptor isoform X2 [Musca domestica]|uniref:Lamin-B receptor isoform X2 n=1 Tax=Musca domestica TaxID=7370 RepID=A0A1I8MPE6_MUSDO|nr:lamin-B receptor isoform X2 [Musca domestica]